MREMGEAGGIDGTERCSVVRRYIYIYSQQRKQGIRTRFSEMFDGEKRAEIIEEEITRTKSAKSSLEPHF